MSQVKKDSITMGTKLKTSAIVKTKIPAIKAPIPTAIKTKTSTSISAPEIKAWSRRSLRAKTSAPQQSPTYEKVNLGLQQKQAAFVSGYEKVKPRRQRQLDSWRDDTDIPIGKRWWSKKRKKQRGVTLATVLVTFAVILVAVLVLIGFGAAYLAKKKGWIGDKRQTKEPVDKRLTTKTNYCRAKISSDRVIDPSCVYEIESDYEDCEVSYCGASKWFIQFGTDSNIPILDIKKRRGISEWSIDKSDFADCGFLKWCRNKTCVGSGVQPNKWWSSQKAFRDSATSQPWVQRTFDTVPCVDKAIDTKSVAALENIEKSYKTCNVDVCSNRLAKYVFRVGWFHCNLDPDPITGLREEGTTSCRIHPLKAFVCDTCKNYTAIDNAAYIREKCVIIHGMEEVEECYYSCFDYEIKDLKLHLFPDGFACNITSPNRKRCAPRTEPPTETTSDELASDEPPTETTMDQPASDEPPLDEPLLDESLPEPPDQFRPPGCELSEITRRGVCLMGTCIEIVDEDA